MPAFPVPTTHTITPGKAWQDDVRFGAIMLAIVVLVNLGLMLWLPHMRLTTSSLPHALVTSEIPAATVQPDNAGGAPVTLYTNTDSADPQNNASLREEASSVPETTAPAPVVHILGAPASHADDAQ